MCVVSMIGDHYSDKWGDRWPGIRTWPDTVEYPETGVQPFNPIPIISREEFDAIKKEVEEMKALLRRAKEYDERNNEPDCEIEEKMALLRKVAQMVGVGLDDVIGRPT